MILDTLANASRYFSLHPRFKQAFEWLHSQRLADIPNGRQEIDGDRLYASVMREAGRGQAVAKYETHRKYIDIQYLVSGSDLIGWAHLTPDLNGLGYDASKDLELYAAKPTLWVPVPTGDFAVFFPEDAHAPMASTCPMHKVVVKVAVA